MEIENVQYFGSVQAQKQAWKMENLSMYEGEYYVIF